MSERRPGSRLPDDPAYWESLAARSVDAAFGASTVSGGPGIAREHRVPAPDPWWRAISDGSFMLAASAVLALLGSTLLLGERSPRGVTETHIVGESGPDAGAMTEAHALAAALAPDEPLLTSLLDASAGPPSSSALLRLMALREEDQ